MSCLHSQLKLSDGSSNPVFLSCFHLNAPKEVNSLDMAERVQGTGMVMIIAVDILRSRLLRAASTHQQRPTSSVSVKARATQQMQPIEKRCRHLATLNDLTKDILATLLYSERQEFEQRCLQEWRVEEASSSHSGERSRTRSPSRSQEAPRGSRDPDPCHSWTRSQKRLSSSEGYPHANKVSQLIQQQRCF